MNPKEATSLSQYLVFILDAGLAVKLGTDLTGDVI